MKTSNNTVFISGGSAGIGFEIAKLLSAKGNRIVINGRDKSRLDKALSQLNNAVAIQGDLSIEVDRLRISEILNQQHPGLNILINNAGIANFYSLGEPNTSYQYATEEISTNYLSAVHLIELLKPTLLSNDNSAIINVTSQVALYPFQVAPSYSASKAALHFYTVSLRKALALSGIKVFELLPPLVNTQLSLAIGGATKGIDPKVVADELLTALEKDQFEIPVGNAIAVYSIFKEASDKLISNSSNQKKN